MKHKFTAISLLCLWIFQSLFVLLFYEIERMECHVQNFARNNPENREKPTQVFFFPKTEKLNWTVEGKEFLLHGKLYDVVTMAEANDLLIIRCFSDKQEDSIVAKFNDFINTKSKQDNPDSKIKKLFDSKYIYSETEFLNTPVCIDYTSHSLHSRRYCCFSIEIIPPPPRVG